eukprot:4086393-Alexandrium_andersonii.AAC.1
MPSAQPGAEPVGTPRQQAPETPRATRSTQRQSNRTQRALAVCLTAALHVGAVRCSCSGGRRVPAE